MIAIAASTVSSNEKLGRIEVADNADFQPPTTDAFEREFGRVVVSANAGSAYSTT